MLTLSDIRDTASSRIYRKGLELQSYKLVKNFEYSIFEESDNSVVADMQGELCGDFDGSSTLVRNIKHYKPQKCGLFYVKFYLFLCCMALFYML